MTAKKEIRNRRPRILIENHPLSHVCPRSANNSPSPMNFPVIFLEFSCRRDDFCFVPDLPSVFLLPGGREEPHRPLPPLRATLVKLAVRAHKTLRLPAISHQTSLTLDFKSEARLVVGCSSLRSALPSPPPHLSISCTSLFSATHSFALFRLLLSLFRTSASVLVFLHTGFLRSF
jgi:hypothetical protein